MHSCTKSGTKSNQAFSHVGGYGPVFPPGVYRVTLVPTPSAASQQQPLGPVGRLLPSTPGLHPGPPQAALHAVGNGLRSRPLAWCLFNTTAHVVCGMRPCPTGPPPPFWANGRASCLPLSWWATTWPKHGGQLVSPFSHRTPLPAEGKGRVNSLGDFSFARTESVGDWRKRSAPQGGSSVSAQQPPPVYE